MAMFTLDFLILTLLLILNLIFMIIRDKRIVYISWVLAFFTWFIGGLYLFNDIDIINYALDIEGWYVIFVIIVALLLFIEKGMEKW